MPDRIGIERFTYETAESWEKIPEGYEFPDASGVTVDSDDNVYILNRGRIRSSFWTRTGTSFVPLVKASLTSEPTASTVALTTSFTPSTIASTASRNTPEKVCWSW